MATYEVESAAATPKWEVESPAKYIVESSQLPQDQRSAEGVGKPTPSFRQGSVADIQPPSQPRRWRPESMLDFVASPLDPEASRDILGAYPKPTVDPQAPFHPGQLIGTIGDELRNTAYDLSKFAIDAVTTPLTYMTAPLIGGRVAGQAPVALTHPVVEAPRPALPDIRSLAARHQEELLAGARTPGEVSSPGETLTQRPLTLGQTPTGSVTRSLDFPVTTGVEPDLSTLPSGSLLRRSRPEEQTTMVPQLEHSPQVPLERRPAPADHTLNLESRRLHGADYAVQGPPKPPLASAEDLLAQRIANYESRHAQLVAEGLELPTTPLDPIHLLEQPPQVGPRGNAIAVPGTKTLTQQQPPLARRLLGSALDVADSLGPYTRRISDIIRYSVDYSEAGTKQNALEYTGLLREVFGDRSLSKKLAAAKDDWTALLNRSVRDYGLTEREARALVELQYVGQKLVPNVPARFAPLDPETIQAAVSPAAWESLRAELLDPRVQRLAVEGGQVGFLRASALPSVQAKARVHDPITGTSEPVGAPSLFFPHQAVNENVQRLLSESNLRHMYNRGSYAESGIDFKQYTNMVRDWVKSKDLGVQQRRFAGLENKRLLDMAEDAKTHNRTIYDSLKYYGYETDPIRASIRHNLYALKRATMLEHGETLQELMGQVRTEYGEGAPYGQKGSTPYNFMEALLERNQGISHNEHVVTKMNDNWQKIQSVLYPAFLKASWASNVMLQPAHVFMQTGFKPIAQTLLSRLGRSMGWSSHEVQNMVEQSAANFPSYTAKYHSPDGLWQQYNKTATDLNMFSPSDNFTRGFTAEVFLNHGEKIIRKWYADPANPKWQKMLQEGNINPQELLKRMTAADRSQWDAQGIPPIPPEALLRYTQTMTNRSMGRMDITSMPMWAAGEGDAHRLFMMLHRQIASNTSHLQRAILDAPTPAVGMQRFFRMTFGAAVGGSLYQGFTNYLVGNNIMDPGVALKKQFPNHQDAAFVLKSIALGYGTLESAIVLAGVNLSGGNIGGAGYAVLSPPAANFLDEMLQKAAQGKWGQVAVKLQPFETPDKLMRQSQTEERKRKQSGMPGQGLNTGVGLSQ